MNAGNSQLLDARALDAFKRLTAQPSLAAAQAREILDEAPQHPMAMLTLGLALRRQGTVDESLRLLLTLAASHPQWPVAQYELGVALGEAGRPQEAVAALRRAVRLQPDVGDAWKRIADHLIELGDPAGADRAYANHIAVATTNPTLRTAAAALCEDRLDQAETLLVTHLQQHSRDADAMRMLAEVAARVGRYEDADRVLELCLQVAPGYTLARYNHAVVLQKLGRIPQCLQHLETLLAADPRNPDYLNVRANALTTIGEFERAIDDFTIVLDSHPTNARIWLAYGHALKTTGRRDDSVAAYRRSIELAPSLGEAYWSLANLKTFRFSDADIAAMNAQAARDDLPDEDRLHFHFALGKSFEDERDFEASFRHYSLGNAVRREGIKYSSTDTTQFVKRSKAFFSSQFLQDHLLSGCTQTGPIFVVGLPRAGSTLIEQILASHSLVEGTMELTDIAQLARVVFDDPGNVNRVFYPEALAALAPAALRELGERYLQQTRIQRKSNAPYFIDKMPNNWMHVGFIHLILPNAKIIDARRHPLSCCFANFKQHFARGQHFSYSLEDLGHYYRDYVECMEHFDEVLPGRVHRVSYERMVDDTEGEIRRMLQYCGLPFEDSCLRFYANARAVRTPSAEQVRQPIFREGMEQWRNYEAWLAPLKEALGPALISSADVPNTDRT